ncbi:uncharacterized protein STEHIDRAFT_100595 [Stereum hirsutum FP-91666 SS1]|uniref:uncharacterized protein n=1 Tax=Stereum hirsutum (strain FP-91666) TaxID=721885 RepID=UPI000444A11A|nr:uncharacterized protein STEHIDRAFT_100595 [Stereum hirsutum FP-91666 SS1]EIM84585.1 hypothetical protein STEHIDRAFT_100595 [Stereum hirsutum FP-91666 SS1]
MVAIELILGPVVVATVTNVFLYGICVVQFSTYYSAGFQDKKLIQALVAWVLLLDTFHVAASVYMLWDYVVTNFNNPEILTAAPWPFPSTPIVTVCASVPIQIFLAYRIKQFSGSWKIFAAIVFLSVAQGAFGIAGATGAVMTPNINDFGKLIPLVDTWLALAVVVDVSITVLLFMYLSRSSSSYHRTKNVVTKIIKSAVETAAFGSFFCIMDLICFSALQSTNFHLIFALPMGRIYTNTLLSTLNSRVKLREEMSGPKGDTSFNLSTNRFAPANNSVRPTQVNIAVEREVQMETYIESERPEDDKFGGRSHSATEPDPYGIRPVDSEAVKVNGF